MQIQAMSENQYLKAIIASVPVKSWKMMTSLHVDVCEKRKLKIDSEKIVIKAKSM